MDLDLLSGYRSRFLYEDSGFLNTGNIIPLSISGINTFPEERYQLNCCSTCEVLKINGLPAVFVFKGIYREGKHPDDFLEVVLSYIKDISGNLIDGCFRLTDAECFDEYEELPWENIFFEIECVSTCQECVPNPEPAPFITNHKIIYPDFKVNNVDPYKAEQIFCEFGNAFYEKALALKFGIQFCCPTDLMQSTIEHEILKMDIVEDKYACCKDKNPCANCSPTQTHLPDLPPCTPSNGPWSYTYGPWSVWSACVSLNKTRTRSVTGTRQCILPYCSTYTEISKSIQTETLDCPCVDAIIFNQTWTGCNATVATYSDGTVIPQITDPTAWNDAVIGAWCYYDNDPSTEAVYGKLYNWYAFMGIHDAASATNPSLRKQLAPVGYHSPDESEWLRLFNNLGGDSVAGGKMKEIGTSHWLSPNFNATNTSNFTALPAGYRAPGGYSGDITEFANFWSTKEINNNSAWLYTLHHSVETAYGQQMNKQGGLSVRFVKGLPCVNCIAHDTFPIGTQIWTGCNANISTYRDGTVIPEVTDLFAWGALTTGAWCYLDNDPANGAKYGKIYNWYAIAGIHDAASYTNPALRKEFAPVGYHVPSELEWNTLINLYGGFTTAGSALKQIGSCNWNFPNSDATDLTGFSAIAAGVRGAAGNFSSPTGDDAFWWSSTSPEPVTQEVNGIYYSVTKNDGIVYTTNYIAKLGASVRFIKN